LANDLRGKDQWILATKKPIVQAFKADAFWSPAHLMGTQVFGFLTLKVKQRDGLLRGEALNFSNEFSGVCPRSAGEAIGCPRRRQRNPINPGPCWS